MRFQPCLRLEPNLRPGTDYDTHLRHTRPPRQHYTFHAITDTLNNFVLRLNAVVVDNFNNKHCNWTPPVADNQPYSERSKQAQTRSLICSPDVVESRGESRLSLRRRWATHPRAAAAVWS